MRLTRFALCCAFILFPFFLHANDEEARTLPLYDAGNFGGFNVHSQQSPFYAIPFPALMDESPDAGMRNRLFEAAEKGTADDVRSLIGQGADVNAKNNDGETPLFCAAFYSSHVEILKCLLENGADVNAEDLDGRTPLDAVYGYAKEAILHDAGGKSGSLFTLPLLD